MAVESGLTDVDPMQGAVIHAASLLTEFSTASAVGLVIFSPSLRFEAVNDAVAAMTHIPPEQHIGNTLRDIAGDAGSQVERYCEKVIATGKPVFAEIAGVLPTRKEIGHWLARYFPLRGRGGQVVQVAGVVVETTQLKKLGVTFRRLTRQQVPVHRECNHLAQELATSLRHYEAGLRLGVTQLSNHPRLFERRNELLREKVLNLDERIVSMRKLLESACTMF